MNDDAKQLLERYQPKPGPVLTLDQQVCIVRASANGNNLAAGGFDGRVRFWSGSPSELKEGAALKGHNGWVQALAFHPYTRLLFTADSWGQLRCTHHGSEPDESQWVVNPAHDGWIRCVAVRPGKLARAAGSEVLVDASGGDLVATCGADHKVCLWSTRNGAKVRELTGHGQDVFSLAFHPDGQSLVSGDLKGVVKQWDLATGQCVREYDAGSLYLYERIQDVGGVRCLAFDPAGETLACAGSQLKSGGFVQGVPTVLFFDGKTGRLKQTLKVGVEADGFVHDLHWHPDGFVMAVTSGQPGNGKLFFHRPGDAQPFFLTTKMPNCHSLAFHPAKNRLVVAATNGGSNGNGRVLGKDKQYAGNWSPLHVWELPKTAT